VWKKVVVSSPGIPEGVGVNTHRTPQTSPRDPSGDPTGCSGGSGQGVGVGVWIEFLQSGVVGILNPLSTF
tara:strand:- start:954 stop:1163 length:210 start_codon:yes stop_codon:yes gene_type:complete